MVLCVATIVLWERTFCTLDSYSYKKAVGPLIVREFIGSSDTGGMGLIVNINLRVGDLLVMTHGYDLMLPGFMYSQATSSKAYSGHVIVKHWLAATVTGIGPLLWVLVH